MNTPERTLSAISDIGLVRSDNQDNFFVSPDNRVLVVADGMGGAANGAEASRLAVEALQKKWTKQQPDYSNLKVIENWLQEAVTEANQSVMKLQIGKNAAHNPGTTIVAAIQADDGVLSIAHVGDSRVFLCHGGIAESVTKDHSFVCEMVANKQLTEEQAWTSPYRNLLTRCLGHDEDVKIEHSQVQLQDGDWALLCTDGLSGVLRPNEIAEIVNDCESAKEVCDRLVSSVKDNHAPDNVTIIALQFEEAGTDDQIEKAPAAVQN